jgi:predicted DNA repair protein MutK
MLLLQSIAIEFTCPVLNQEATAVAMVQSVFNIITLCEAVPLNVVKLHHNTSFQSESCLISIAQALGQVHTFVVNVASTVQSVLYLTILFLVVHHIVVKFQDITTFQSACSNTQVICQSGKKKLVNVLSIVKSVLNTFSLVAVHKLNVTAVAHQQNILPLAYHICIASVEEKPVKVFHKTKDISV